MPPPVHGAAMMGKYIHDSNLINNEFECHYINLTTAKTLNDIGKLGFYKIKSFLVLLLNVIKTVIFVRPNLVYITPNASGNAFYKDFVVVEIVKFMGCKVVLHYHNKGITDRQNKWFDNILFNCFFRKVKVILLAEQLYYDVKKYLKRDNVYICSNGIPEINQSIKETPNGFKILFLSNMMKEKGVYTLLEACKILKKRNLYFHCDFVGQWSDITENDFNRYLDEHQLVDKVKAYGAKYGEAKTSFLKEASLFVFPSNNEAFGLVLIEAMQHSIACIATLEGGIPSIIDDGKTGFLIEKQNSLLLADKIEFLICNPDICKKMGDMGYSRYNNKFTLGIFENRLKIIFEDIMQDNNKLNNS